MVLSEKYQNWKLDRDDQGILWLAIDRKNSSVNSLNREVLTELNEITDLIQNEQSIKSIIVYSAKKSGFIAGADISQFTELKTVDEAFELIRQGQTVFDKWSALSKPTVAMIEGFCLGGGLEFALACRYRVAAHARLGLPEVLLGIHPGWGGTIRLPELIGALNAMKLILTGKSISAEEAAKYGVIDAAVPERALKNAAIYYATKCPPPHKPNWFQRLTNNALIRPIISRSLYAKLLKRIKPEHYPAPFAVIRNWEQFGVDGEQAMMNEAKSISELMLHPTSRNLVRVFFLRERLKNLAKGVEFDPLHVHVIGAGGVMGGDIAAWSALSGFQVTLQDRTAELIATTFKRANELASRKYRSKREIKQVMDRLTPDLEGKGIKKADVVIEAIIENLTAKQTLFRELEPQLKSDCVLATNTSSLPLSSLNEVLKEAQRLVGLHFFNPVAKMELIEVVSDTNTDPKMFKKALAFVKKLNKLPLPVMSSPGFLVNRVLMPYLLESVLMLEEGLSAEQIDKAAVDFGMPMGPIELCDRVGLDICLSVAEILTQYLGGEVPALLREMVMKGNLGVKARRGFYDYTTGKMLKKTEKLVSTDPEITDRLIFRMLNESIACLREGVVTDSDLLDAGMIFGTGFAPFRGGPINYARTLGINNVCRRLDQLSNKYGTRFLADVGWDMLKEKDQEPSEHPLPHMDRPRPSAEIAASKLSGLQDREGREI